MKGGRAGEEQAERQEPARVVRRPGYLLVVHSEAAVAELLRALLRSLDRWKAEGAGG